MPLVPSLQALPNTCSRRLVSTLVLALGLATIPSGLCAQDEIVAKNVVLFIGDGVDDHILTIGRNYLFGNLAGGDTFSFDSFEARQRAEKPWLYA